MSAAGDEVKYCTICAGSVEKKAGKNICVKCGADFTVPMSRASAPATQPQFAHLLNILERIHDMIKNITSPTTSKESPVSELPDLAPEPQSKDPDDTAEHS